MANEKFKVKFGLAVGDTVATVDGTTGDIITAGDIAVNGGDITTTSTTANIVNTTATTVNIAGAGTTVNIGATTGDTNIRNDLIVAGNTTLGNSVTDTIDFNGVVVDNITFSFNDTATPRGILGQMSTGAVDYWFVGGAEASGTSDAGFAMIATGDNGNDPIYARQYNGSPLSGTVNKQLTLLDASGNTSIPGTLTTNGDVYVENNGNLYVSGQSLVLNNNDTAGGNVEVVAYRGTGGATSTKILWNETTDRWTFTNDGTNYTNLPVATDSPTYAGATLGNITVGVATDNTIATTSGDLILDSASGIIQLADPNLSSTVAQTWTLLDNNASALSIGATGKADMLKFITTDGAEQLTTSSQFIGDSGSISRFTRTVAGAAANVVLELTRNRADSVRVADQGPWLGFGYVGTDNVQATAGQNAIRSMYDTAGNHKLQFEQIPSGNYATPTIIGQAARGATFFNTTAGVANLFLSDTVARIGGNTTTISNSANTANYAVFGSTFTTLASSGTTYAALGPGSATFTVSGFNSFIRQGTTNTTQPALLVRYQRTDTTGSNDGDGVDFRLSTAGTVTTDNIARFDAQYRATGLHTVGISVSTDSFSADSDSIYRGQADQTVIRATPAGTTGTAADVLTITQSATTLKSDALTLQDAAGVALVGGKISYGRQYLEAYSTQDQTNPVANAENLMSFNNTGISNGVSVVTNGTTLSRITMSTAGVYNIQFSAQLNQSTGGAHNAFIWLKKNGTAVANTAGDTRIAGNGDRIMAAWNYIVSASAGDYYELAWASSDTNVLLDYVAAAAPVPAIPSVILTVVPVGA